MAAADSELIERFVASRDEDAFAELARRHLPCVLGTAFRMLGDASEAEDVAQMVFTRLATRVQRVPRHTVLGGWLHADTRLVALQLLRSRRRRKEREKIAMLETPQGRSGEPDWDAIRPWLDETLEALPARDRDVLILRFFEQLSLGEIGARVGLADDAIRMRLTRALERLREALLRKGIATTGAALSAVLTAHAATPVLPELSRSIVALALAAPPAVVSSVSLVGPQFLTATTMTKSSSILIAALALGVAIPLALQQRTNSRLLDEVRLLTDRVAELQRAQSETSAGLDALRAESAAIRTRTVATDGKRTGSAGTDRSGDIASGRGSGRTATGVSSATQPHATASTLTEEDVQRFKSLPPSDQGKLLGGVRFAPPNLGPADAVEFQKNRELAGRVRTELESLEDRPADFAAFQTAFIGRVSGLDDAPRLAGIREVIQQTYERAQAEGLVASTRPSDGVEEWAGRRDALDRAATRKVQELLTPEERARFDGAFLGVMGVDLGLGDGKWHRFINPDGSIAFPSEERAAVPQPAPNP